MNFPLSAGRMFMYQDMVTYDGTMGRETTEADRDCTRCGDYGFTVHQRKGRRYPYPCPACDSEKRATVLDAQRALSEHGDDLRTTYAQ